MVDRSIAGWDIIGEYETESIASNSDDRKKIEQAKNKTLNKRKSKTFNKSTVDVSCFRTSGHQFPIPGQHNDFKLQNQQN